MSDSSSPRPSLATWPVLRLVLALLTGALVLEIALSPHWTEPFRESETWVLLGVMVGVGLRGLGRRRARRGQKGEALFRRLSLIVWGGTALGGLLSLLF